VHRFIGNIQPDIIHVFSAAPGFVVKLTKLYHWLRFAKTKFPPVVSSVMGLQSSPNESIIKTQIRNLFITLGAKRVFIISPAIRAYLQKLPVRRRRLKDLNVVGIKIPASASPIIDKRLLKHSLGIPIDNRVVMTIGRLSPAKSHELFIDAALLLLQRQKNITFLIVGIGPLQENLQTLIQNKNAVSNIKLLGLRTDVYNLLSICDVYVKPGIVEGFIGITVLEAQAMGVPVVAWYTRDVTLAIEDGKTGCIIKNVDIGAMGQTLEMLLNDRNTAARIGENGRAFVKKTFAIEGIARDLVKAYEQEISGATQAVIL
jgi:Glycosyltransferase